MPAPIQAANLPSKAAARAKAAASKARRDQIAGKTFAQLNPAEKDVLLKEIAIQLELIQPDP